MSKIDDKLSLSDVTAAYKALVSAHRSFTDVASIDGAKRDNDKVKAMMLLFEAAAANMRGALMPMFNKRLMSMPIQKWESYPFPSIPTDVATTMFWIRTLLEDSSVRKNRPSLKDFNHSWMEYDGDLIKELMHVADWQEVSYELKFAADDMMEFYVVPAKNAIRLRNPS